MSDLSALKRDRDTLKEKITALDDSLGSLKMLKSSMQERESIYYVRMDLSADYWKGTERTTYNNKISTLQNLEKSYINGISNMIEMANEMKKELQIKYETVLEKIKAKEREFFKQIE